MNALCSSMGTLRVTHWHASPSAASLRAAPARPARPAAVATEAAFTSQERRVRRHLALRKKARTPHAADAHSPRRLRAPFGLPACRQREKHTRAASQALTLPRCALRVLRAPQLSGSEERPRLAVFRSNQHIYAQARALSPRSTCRRAAVCRVLVPGRCFFRG